MASPVNDLFGFPILDSIFGIPSEVYLGGLAFLKLAGIWPVPFKGPLVNIFSYISLAVAALIAAKRYDLIPAGTYYTTGYQ